MTPSPCQTYIRHDSHMTRILNVLQIYLMCFIHGQCEYPCLTCSQYETPVFSLRSMQNM